MSVWEGKEEETIMQMYQRKIQNLETIKDISILWESKSDALFFIQK